MKVVVLTTSYPTVEHPVAGTFVARSVEAARAAGVTVEVVSPADVRDFGIAFGSGIAQNLRRAPWKTAFVLPFLAAFARAARTAAADADLVHAHWIPTALVARATGKPYVLQVWGTDVDLARRAPRLVRPLVSGARLVLAASEHLAEEAHRLGARSVAIVPVGIPAAPPGRSPDAPPHVLYAGRLSAEKGILEFVAATQGVPRVVVGDGPLRAQVPDAIGFVPPDQIGAYYERAAVVCVPSRREGYGMTAREAMAHGRAVVATRVGGLAELGEGAVLVPGGDVEALREAIVSALAQADALGARARQTAESDFGLGRSTELLLDAYAAASDASG